MHLVPPARAHQPSIDDHRACQAIEALGTPEHLAAWSARFSLLGDPHRLAILLCVGHAGPISVTDLALATGMNATAVSQVLRLLRASGTVTGTRDGRVIRYRLTDRALDPLLAMATLGPAEASAAPPAGRS
ncbi:ArsR/SmtB family transcription factor [Streptacidiphilus sp. EB129]|uniref:ArsR/SmtB family transcription factor n=1 Tax=Streptacidiphilus sp. EB129 TaxID=3156262 RepID=UPI00351409DD